MMMSLRQVGLVVNPLAGHGAARNSAIAARAIEVLAPEQVTTGAGSLGAAALAARSLVSPGGPRLTTLTAGIEPGRRGTMELVRRLLRRKPDAIVVVGGDGTMADAATVCLEEASQVPIIGIGVGSTNVGPLVTVPGDRVDLLRGTRLVSQPLDALVVQSAGANLGAGFHDVVVGFTVVGTRDGQRLDVDAAALAGGRVTPGRPRSIGRAHTRITRVGPDGEIVLGEGARVAGVVVAVARPEFFGQALAGGACLTALAGLPAGCLVSDRPLVQVEVTPQELLAWPPLQTWYASLDEGWVIRVEQTAVGAAVSADGNPLHVFRGDEAIEIGVRRGAVVGARRVGPPSDPTLSPGRLTPAENMRPPGARSGLEARPS